MKAVKRKAEFVAKCGRSRVIFWCVQDFSETKFDSSRFSAGGSILISASAVSNGWVEAQNPTMCEARILLIKSSPPRPPPPNF